MNKYLASAAFFLTLLTGVLLFGGQVAKAYSIPGSPSSVYPDTSVLGDPPTYMMNELCSGPSNCMRSKNTVAAIHVPIGLRNTWIGVRIEDGCDDTGNDWNGGGSFTTYSMIRVPVSPTADFSNLRNLDSDTDCGSAGGNDVQFYFYAQATGLRSDMQGDQYDTYYFVGDTTGPGNTDGIYHYNSYRLHGPGSTRIGVSPLALPCPIAQYPYSCPSEWFPGSGSFAFSSFGQPPDPAQPNGGSYRQRIAIADCTVRTKGRIDLYDLDSTQYGQNITVRMTVTHPDGTVTYIPSSGTPVNVTGAPDAGNDRHFILPPLSDPTPFIFEPGFQYLLEVDGLTRANTLQILTSWSTDNPSDGANCRPNNPPQGALDSVGCTTINGWTFDGDYPNNPIQVGVYMDGPAGVGSYLGNFWADQPRGDINAAYGIGGNHGFNVPLPLGYQAGSHTVYVYAIDVDGSGTVVGGTNPQVTNSPLGYTYNSAACTPGDNDVVGSFSVDCNTFTAFSMDPDQPTWDLLNGVFVRVAGTAGWSYYDTILSPNPGHSFSFSIPAAYQNTTAYEWTVDAYGWQPDGSPSASSTPLGVALVPPCVTEQPVSGNFDGNCSSVFGVAQDPDQPTWNITIGLYVRIPSVTGWTFYGNIVADQPGHNFSFIIPNAYKSSTITYEWTGDAYGYKSDGSPADSSVSLGSKLVGPCQGAQCSLIQVSTDGGSTFSGNIGWGGTYFIYASQTFTVRQTYTNTAPGVGGTSWNGNHRIATSDDPAVFTRNDFRPTTETDGNLRLYKNEAGLIAPGDTATFDYSKTAPGSSLADLKDYNFKFRFLEEGVEWFNLPSDNATCAFTIRVIPPPAIPTCDSIVYNPLIPQPGQPFTIEVNISNAQTHPLGSSFGRPDTKISIWTSAPLSYSNPDAAYTPDPVGPGASAKFTTAPPLIAPSGNYTVVVTLTSPAWGNGSCSAPLLVVAARPYFKVYNGDTLVGANFNTDNLACAPSATGGKVEAFADYDAVTGIPTVGASTELGLQAKSLISGMYSSSVKSNRTPLKEALTFANNSVANTWGGNFGRAGQCIKDYYSITRKPTTVFSASVADSVEGIASAAGTVANQAGRTGNLTLSGTGATPFPGKLAIYVDGDVYINGNINLKTDYSGGIGTIPFLALLVKGNIYIASTVTNIDGMIVAQPNGGAKGIIYTCSSGIGTLGFSLGDSVTSGSSTMNSGCSQQLTFNGMVVAKGLKLLRTRGTLVSAAPSEYNTPGPNIAEVFNGMPEMYLADTPFKTDAAANRQYDNAASLPPIL